MNDKSVENNAFHDVKADFLMYGSPCSSNFKQQKKNSSPEESSEEMFVASSSPYSLASDSSSSCTTQSAKKNDDLCLVCGDRASGYHYNALSCEGCKGFFRRSITRDANYSCKFEGQCEMDMWMRRKCQFCRLRRCREVGMREDCLLSDEQCRARQHRRRNIGGRHFSSSCSNPAAAAATSSTKILDDGSSKNVVQCSLDKLFAATPVHLSVLEDGMHFVPSTTTSDENIFDDLNIEHQQLISMLVELQDEFELPKPERLPTCTVEKLLLKGLSLNEAVFQIMTMHMLVVTELIVEFVKRLPGFKDIMKEDQVDLLKGSANEIVMLRLARRYDPISNTVVFPDGKRYTCQQMCLIGDPKVYVEMFRFCRRLSETLHLDNAEYALLTSICIFQERDTAQTSAKLIESKQEPYVDCLRCYCAAKQKSSTGRLALLLMVLTELRVLGHKHNKMLSELKGVNVPPLLEEYFNVTKTEEPQQ